MAGRDAFGREAFNRDVFYRQLDEVYERRDVGAIEQFLLDTQRRLAEDRAYAMPGCDLCVTPQEREMLNSGYVKNLLTVQNELLSLYRGVNRFDECLQISAVMKQEMKDLRMDQTDQYAILLLNEGTAFRMMRDQDRALANFDQAETILARLMETRPHSVDPFTLATLYNNRAPVLLQRGRAGGPGEARADFEKALADLRKALDLVRGIGRMQQEEAVTLCGIAETCSLLGDDEAGEQAADEAVALYEAAGSDPHKGAALNVKARFLFKRKEFTQAAALFREAAQITKSYYGENDDYRICMANAQRAEEAAR